MAAMAGDSDTTSTFGTNLDGPCQSLPDFVLIVSWFGHQYCGWSWVSGRRVRRLAPGPRVRWWRPFAVGK